MTKSPFQLDDSRTIVVPTGGDFQLSGFIGPWVGAVMMCILTMADVSELKERGITNYDMSRKAGPEWNRYYWHDYDAANMAATAMGEAYAPRKAWVFDTETQNILNFAKEETAQKFGPHLTFDHCSITSLYSRKYRHELHMVALPSFVQAYARMMWEEIEVPEFKAIRELADQNTIFTDAFQLRMIGDPNNPNEYEQSELWQYRKTLWSSLGEENPHAYQMIGSGTKFDTTSEKLNEALSALYKAWTAPVYLRLVLVPDPREDAKNKNNGNRLSIPAVVDIFKSKSDAEAAAKVDGEHMGKENETTTQSPLVPDLPVPNDWAGYPSDWMGQVRGIKARGPKPRVIAALREQGEESVYNEFAATIQDIEAWWDHV